MSSSAIAIDRFHGQNSLPSPPEEPSVKPKTTISNYTIAHDASSGESAYTTTMTTTASALPSAAAPATLVCDGCGKTYKHPSCLAKHRWEHSDVWDMASQLLLTKHQQVQLLEAASILVGMMRDQERLRQERIMLAKDTDLFWLDDDTLESEMDMQYDDDDDDDEDEEEEDVDILATDDDDECVSIGSAGDDTPFD
ncbi:hypothetical protein BC940DRAFT_348680 [Gongronella butleri]|nr:hypothetical protein BC940DRAFT_348680 [Gongronella butleri]